jgi:hypothetical protein
MDNLEKIQALQAGEFDSEYGQGVSASGVWLLKNVEAMNIDEIIADLQANAAKVEVTKGVLDEVIIHIHREIKAHGDSDFINPALTLLKTLQEALKQC